MTKPEMHALRCGFNDGLHWVGKRQWNEAYDRGYKLGKQHPKSVTKQAAWRSGQGHVY